MTNAREKPPEFEVIGEKYETAGSFNERAKAFFRRRAGVELTDEDVREIAQNLMQLFDLLEAAEVEEEQANGLTAGEGH